MWYPEMATVPCQAGSAQVQPVPTATLRGRFERSPFHGELSAAEMSMLPLHKPSEFWHVSDFEHISDVPVILSPSQRYRFLADLVDGLVVAIPSLRLSLIRLGAPDYRTQLPRRLLQADVLLSHDPWLFVPALDLAAKGCVAVIWQELRTDSVEPGDNGLAITIFGPDGSAGLPAFAVSNPLLAELAHCELVHGTL
jgi:hypothetical protein